MKRTLTINLNSNVFNIDEDAYDTLKAYLNELENHFSKKEDKEILDDIEARIGELFSEKLNSQKTVIEQQDVDEVIGILGRPEQFDEESSDENAEEKKTGNTEKKQSRRRKLYRDPDDTVISGVASGLAAYLGWEPRGVRWLLVLLVLLSQGWVILVYLIMWILVPEAKTAAQKLEMHGENANLNNIKNFYETNIEPSKENIKSGFVQFIGWVAKILLIAVGVILAICAISILVLVVVTIVSIFIGEATILPWYASLNMDFGSPISYVMLILLALVIIIPIAGVIKLSFRLIRNKNTSIQKSHHGWILALVWLASFIALFTMSMIYIFNNQNDFDRLFDNAETYIERNVDSLKAYNAIEINDAIKVKFVSNDTTVHVSGGEWAVNHLTTSCKDSVLRLSYSNHFNNRKWWHNFSGVTVYLPVPQNLKKINVNSASQLYTDDNVTLNLDSTGIDISSAAKANLNLKAKYIDLDVNSAGRAILSGTTNMIKADVNSAAKANLENLAAKNGKVVANSAAKAYVNISDTARLDANGAGKIIYSGWPVVLYKHADGAGKIVQRNN